MSWEPLALESGPRTGALPGGTAVTEEGLGRACGQGLDQLHFQGPFSNGTLGFLTCHPALRMRTR